MPKSGQYVVLAEPIGPTPARTVLERLGCSIDTLDSTAVDHVADAPERLESSAAGKGKATALVIAIAAQREGAASLVEWDGMVHLPLQRCFTVVRGIVPGLLTHPEGARVVFVLPLSAFFADDGQCADSVLGRALMGLAEGLRAELLPTAVRVSIVLTDGADDDAVLTDRITEALLGAPLYAVSPAATEHRVGDVFAPWLDALSRTPSELGMPPMGPMGEVYQSAKGHSARQLKGCTARSS